MSTLQLHRPGQSLYRMPMPKDDKFFDSQTIRFYRSCTPSISEAVITGCPVPKSDSSRGFEANYKRMNTYLYNGLMAVISDRQTKSDHICVSQTINHFTIYDSKAHYTKKNDNTSRTSTATEDCKLNLQVIYDDLPAKAFTDTYHGIFKELQTLVNDTNSKSANYCTTTTTSGCSDCELEDGERATTLRQAFNSLSTCSDHP